MCVIVHLGTNKNPTSRMKKKRHWTIQEDELLIKQYPEHQTTDIAILLGRPVKAIYNRTMKLGLNKTFNFIRSTNTTISRARYTTSATYSQNASNTLHRNLSRTNSHQQNIPI